MTNVGTNLLARSRRLASDKFAGALDLTLHQEEQVLLVDDCDAEIFEFTRPSPKSGLVAVLTASRLFLLRGRGLMGGQKKPWILNLDDLEHVAVTEEGNVNLRATDTQGQQHMWKLVFREMDRADLWMQEIGRACQPEEQGEDGNWLFRLHDCLEALAPLAAPSRIGTSFGPGTGLEEAVEAIRMHLRSPGEARSCGRAMITELLTQVPGDDLELRTLEVMGATELRAGGATEGRQDLELAGAAMTLIGQSRAPGSLWKLWEERDDVVVELLAWHCVARLRLTTGGQTPPIARPAPV